MRISELSARTGVALATVKFYLREGLLPRGEKSSATQAQYGPEHVARLRLLRLLREVGDLPVARLRGVVEAAADPTRPLPQVIGTAARALAPDPPTVLRQDEASRRQAEELAEQLIAQAGWTRVTPDSPDRRTLAAVLELVRAEGHGLATADALRAYAEAADTIGRLDIAALDGGLPAEQLVEQLVVGQVAFGTLLLTLRRLAEEHHCAQRFEG